METQTAAYFISPVEVVPAASALAAVQESIDEEFSRHLNPVIQFAKRLPALSGNMLELHFDKDVNCFDFACRINPKYDRHLLSHPGFQHHISSSFIKEYDQLTDRPKTGFRFGIENVWFEYDFPFHLQPALFLDLNRGKDFDPAEVFPVLEHLAGSFHYSIAGALLDFLVRIKALDLYVVYYGFMFSRHAAALRLTINGVKAHNLFDMLQDLGWTGNYKILKEVSKQYFCAGQELVLSVDFDKRPGTRIGIEVFDKSYNGLITALRKNNVISSNHFKLLERWNGTLHLPEKTQAELSKLYRRSIACIFKRTNHVKFIIDNDSVTAKAYLYYCF